MAHHQVGALLSELISLQFHHKNSHISLVVFNRSTFDWSTILAAFTLNTELCI